MRTPCRIFQPSKTVIVSIKNLAGCGWVKVKLSFSLIEISSNINGVFDFGFKSSSDWLIKKDSGSGWVRTTKIGVGLNIFGPLTTLSQ